jgi:signal transduction histidine kinase
MIAAACDERLPLTVEARLAVFTRSSAPRSPTPDEVQLDNSRARIVAAADETRRRIERDLHDSVQQHLISLALTLRTAQVAAPPAARELAERLDGVIEGLGAVIDELREISRGIHPSALVQGGLHPALKTLARRSAVPVRLDVRIAGRLPEQIEVTAYYAVAEALANTAKHAQASVVDVTTDVAAGMLRVRVCDDGSGGANPATGSGLVGLRDRVEALGGQVWLTSPVGAGTTLRAVIPLHGPSATGLVPTGSTPADGAAVTTPVRNSVPELPRGTARGQLPTRVPLSRHSVRAARRPSVSRNSRIWTQPTSSTGSSPRGQTTTGI